MLAIEHRSSLSRALGPAGQKPVSDGALVAFKLAVVAALSPVASAVLLNAEYGATGVVRGGVLPGATGLVVTLDRSGYTGHTTARVVELVPEWDADRAKRIEASGVKLLVYYHPDSATARQTEELATQGGRSCLEAQTPLFLEVLTYSPDQARARLSSGERRYAVVEAARRPTSIPGVDVLKAEFPLDVTVAFDVAEWEAACRELMDASILPWVLLSAGVDIDTYLKQVAVAAQAGPSGVAAGRAIWRKATVLPPRECDSFLASSIARKRMERVTGLCQALARPWSAGLPSTLVTSR